MSEVDRNTYVGVENLLQDKQGRTAATSVPAVGSVFRFLPGDILVGNIRPYLRKIWLADCAGGTNGDVLAIRVCDRDAVEPGYLYHVLASEAFVRHNIQHSKGAKMPRGSKEAVMKFSFPLPPLPVQHDIVRILDKFSALCSSISEGLPAEIEARRKQYEYYRDRLLSFREKSASVGANNHLPLPVHKEGAAA